MESSKKGGHSILICPRYSGHCNFTCIWWIPYTWITLHTGKGRHLRVPAPPIPHHDTLHKARLADTIHIFFCRPAGRRLPLPWDNMLETNNDIDFSTNNLIPIADVVAQMEKEIQMSGEQKTFNSDNPTQLITALAAFLKQIDSGTRVQNLFYRIDINPAKKDDNLPYYEALATLAWNRVFQKVWFRREFKTENK